MPTLRTLCSGGELFGVGARAAGYTHLDGYEIEAPIAAVAQLNGFDVRVADVCDVDYESLAPVDHLHASPSCKTASQANTNGGETPGDLAVADAICRAIRAHQGKTASIENVWGYRNFESFARILATLHESGYAVDYRHINAADFGVPQTRKHLILRAVRGTRVPPLHPTHRKDGDMFHAPWVGWYRAIEDLLDTLPETTPAPWQLARMPKELRETLLIGPGGYDGTVVQAAPGDPSFTVADGGNHAQWRAFLVAGVKSPHGDGLVLRECDEPATTVVSADEGRIVTRAYLVGGGNTQLAQVDSHARLADQPAFTVRDGANGSPERAFLLDGDNASHWSGEPDRRLATEPAMTMRGTRTPAHRAYVGRWVRMTIQALGRFQTVPDDYIGLTPTINGNGVPCLLARAIMESLQEIAR